MEYKTLVDIFIHRRSDDIGITFIEGSEKEVYLSYHNLYEQALSTLLLLQNKGLEPGDELVLQLDNSQTYIIVFWACILGGIIPIPLTIGRTDDHRLKLFNVWEILNNPHLIISEQDLEKLAIFAETKGLQHKFEKLNINKILFEESIFNEIGHGKLHYPKEDDIAYVQFSSGSTGDPKGVILTHKNLLTNSRAILKSLKSPKSGEIFFTWMPLTHDMGLIGFHITPFVAGWQHYIMPTELFIRRPSLWLQKISEHKVTFTASPNFGYRYVINRFDKKSIIDLNLSCLRLLANGAEPISAVLCEEFTNKFAEYGLHKNVIFPVYGLAEASLAVTFTEPLREIQTLKIDRAKLNCGDSIAEVKDKEGLSFVNVGEILENCYIRLTDSLNNIVDEDIIGRIQIKGDNVTRGYYNNPNTSEKIISKDGWLDTGDLGFMRNSCLYITGRAKDIIFINGQNFYPHDIERVCEDIEGIELGKIIVSAFFNDKTQQEEVITFVLHKGKPGQFLPLVLTIKKHINHNFGFEVEKVIPVREIPKTTSGKFQRFKLMEQYRQGLYQDIEKEINQLLSFPESQKTIIPPENDIIEEKIFTIWKQTLGHENFGVTNNFFEIGGNSLKGGQIIMKIFEELHVELSFKALFEDPTIRAITLKIEKDLKQDFYPIEKANLQDHYPLSSAQRRLYYLWELDKSSIAYNIPVAFQIDGKIDLRLIEEVITKIIRRHEIFRTSFSFSNGEPNQIIDKETGFKLKSSTIKEKDTREQLQRRVVPFDLTQAPLFRTEVLKIQEDKQILFIDFHHIIADGLSIHNFLDELFRSYEGEKLLPLAVQYKDYVLWEKGYNKSYKIIEQEKYWLKELGDDLPTLNFPTDYPRPMMLSFEGEKLAFKINSELTKKLKTLAVENNVTLYMLLLTMYNILLSKYTGQEDLIVGVPSAGRKHPMLQLLLGMFVNNLAIRNEVSGEKSFIQFLAEIKNKALKSFDNQDYPFEVLVENLVEQRDISRNNLFDTMFIFQNMGLPKVKSNDFKVNRYFFDPGISKYDLSIEIFENDDIIEYYLEYSTKLFRKETILKISSHFENIIQEIVELPERKISDISMLSKEEFHQFIYEFNNTKVEYPKDKTIIDLFEEQVKSFPNNIAVIYEEEQITYKQLNEKANQLSCLLNEKGVLPDMCVGIMIDKSSELIISILAVLKAGGCYLPIDADLPEERIQYLVEDSKTKLIITNGASLEKCHLSFQNIPDNNILRIDQIHFNRKNDIIILEKSANPENLAYIIYTSGTTGDPKGVMINHQSLVNYCCWAAKTYVRDEHVSFPLFTSPSFDLTITSIFTPLITGNTIFIYNDDEKHLSIEKVILDNKVDIIKLTPSHLNIIRDSKIKSSGESSKIKRFIVGGEQLDTDLANEIHNKFEGGIEIFNEYGPTEATVGCMIYKFNPRDAGTSVPVGVPIMNSHIYLLDKNLMPVATGVSGEMYISGDCLSRGYIFKPTLTEHRFIPNPFIQGKKMYQTGDIAKRLTDGNIEFVGRADHQVKIKGHRIELSEIEAHLIKHNQITQALVIDKKDEKGEKYLCAYYVSIKTNKLEVSELRNFLTTFLPLYMVPSYFIHVDKMPLSKHGKVNFKALPEPDKDLQKETLIDPRNELEALFIKIWQDVLNFNKISINTNFYELGGDSIKAVQIVSRLFDKGISVNAKDILTYQTIEQIGFRAKITDARNQYDQGIIEGEKGLTPIEAWFFNQSFFNPNYYNQSVLLELNHDINVSLLQISFQKLIEHHDGLRLNYKPESQTLFYNNELLDRKFTIEVFDLSQIDENYRNQKLIAIGSELKGSIDITNGLLIKAILIKESNQFSKLLITAHHLLIDGISWRILLEDLKYIYDSLKSKEKIILPAKTASLKDWYHEIIKFSHSDSVEKDIAYWRDIEETFEISKDFQTNNLNVGSIDQVRGKLSNELTEFLLKEAHKVYNTDVLTLLITALVMTMDKWITTEEIVIELESHGRHLEDIDISRTIGWFTAIYPLRVKLINNDIGEQIKLVKKQIREVPNSGLSYGILKYITKTVLSKKEMCGIRFNYLGQFDNELNNDMFSYINIPMGSETDMRNHMTSYVELNCMILNNELNLEIIYNTLLNKDIIHSFSNSYIQHLIDILEHIRKKVNVYYTPNDFDTTELDEEDLSVIFV